MAGRHAHNKESRNELEKKNHRRREMFSGEEVADNR